MAWKLHYSLEKSNFAQLYQLYMKKIYRNGPPFCWSFIFMRRVQ